MLVVLDVEIVIVDYSISKMEKTLSGKCLTPHYYYSSVVYSVYYAVYAAVHSCH